METKEFLEQCEEKLNRFVEANGFFSPIEVKKMLVCEDNDIDDFYYGCRYSHSKESNYVREKLKKIGEKTGAFSLADLSDIVRESIGLHPKLHTDIENTIGFLHTFPEENYGSKV